MASLFSLPLAYWTHDLSPFVVRFGEHFGIRWYGLSYVFGFIAAGVLLHVYYHRGRSPWNPEFQSMALMAIAAGVVVGGRMGYMLFYDLHGFLRSPIIFFKVWEGGMASHGGFIGMALAVAWFSRRSQIPFLRTADLFATLAPPGLFFGRVANFVNGELPGKITDVPWAVLFPGGPLPLVPRHPSQLYEAALEGLFLSVYLQLRFWKGDPQRRSAGRLCGEFFLLYALVRIVCELYREPDAELILGMSRGIFFSLFLAFAGVVFIAFAPFFARTRGA